MKPLFRNFIYDKLRKNLYKHEFKRLVTDNPYFPVFRPIPEEVEDLSSIFNWTNLNFDANSELIAEIERINNSPLYDKSSFESYENFLDTQVTGTSVNNTALICLRLYAHIIRDWFKKIYALSDITDLRDNHYWIHSGTRLPQTQT